MVDWPRLTVKPAGAIVKAIVGVCERSGFGGTKVPPIAVTETLPLADPVTVTVSVWVLGLAGIEKSTDPVAKVHVSPAGATQVSVTRSE